jgi:hypothetical protein
MSYNLLKFIYKWGIEAFNLLNFLTSYLLNFFPFSLDHETCETSAKAFYYDIIHICLN